MDAEVWEKLEWRDWKESESYVEDRIDGTQGPAGYDGQSFLVRRTRSYH